MGDRFGGGGFWLGVRVDVNEDLKFLRSIFFFFFWGGGRFFFGGVGSGWM